VLSAEIGLYCTNGGSPTTGYGRMERGLLRGLRQAGWTVLPFSFPYRDDLPLERAILIGRPLWAEEYPTARRLWCCTMSESSRVSPEWVEALNRHYAGVMVPCPGLVDVYRDSGVRVPVHCVPLGVDFSEIAYVERDPQPEVFTWLTCSYGDMRKGAHLAMFAFNRLFGGDVRHRLIVKCRDEPRWLDGLQDEQITVIQGEISEADWQALLAKAHVFLFPSYGEGFGLPPREAALSGLPVISSEWLGLWDAAEWGWPVPMGRMLPAQFDFWEANAQGSQWAEPDTFILDDQMRRVIENYPAALKMARRGRDYLLENFTWAQAARRIGKIVQQEYETEMV